MVDCSGLENLAGKAPETAETADFCGSQAAQDAPFRTCSDAPDGTGVGTRVPFTPAMISQLAAWSEELRRATRKNPPRPRPKTALVYFIGHREHAIKIGYTEQLRIRLAALRNASPVPLTVLATVDSSPALEREYHERFGEHRLHGEWFLPHPDILAEVDRLNNGA